MKHTVKIAKGLSPVSGKIVYTKTHLSLTFLGIFLILFLELALAGDRKNIPETAPSRVVSLVPSVTEIIEELGESEKIVGITLHDCLPITEDRKIVGSFFHPFVGTIRSVKPDLIIIPSRHEKSFKETFPEIPVVTVEIKSLEELFQSILTLGSLFQRKDEAEKLIYKIRSEIELIKQKVSTITDRPFVRVTRFMGRSDSETLMVPGDGSFQNELIRLAGGTPPSLGKKGEMVPITVEEWRAFNPEFIYGCGEDRQAAEKFFSLPGWKDVTAVEKNNIVYFPCDLTCRISPNTGKFIQWLASMLYGEYFSERSYWILKNGIKSRKYIPINLSYVASAEVVTSSLMDFENKTLIVRFSEPMKILSTLDGIKEDQKIVGNHSSPPPLWNIGHKLGLDGWRRQVEEVLELPPLETTLLFTGASMDNLSVQSRTYGDLTVYALVTAGAKSNALRASKDEGIWEEAGTINIILMTNRQLSPRAMTRAIITATEAKTAALQDLDIRSSYNGMRWQATGTGTDEIIVVAGKGKYADNTGGHARLGELIAKAVYDGVKEALKRQNRFYEKRSIFQRLQERHIELYSLLPKELRSDALPKIEKLLIEPRYEAFMEIAFFLSDADERDAFNDLNIFIELAHSISREIAKKQGHKKVPHKIRNIVANNIPEPISIALNAILTGLYPYANIR